MCWRSTSELVVAGTPPAIQLAINALLVNLQSIPSDGLSSVRDRVGILRDLSGRMNGQRQAASAIQVVQRVL